MARYVKFHGPSCVNDWARVRALHKASLAATAFESPEPFNAEFSEQSIEYEHLPEGQLLANMVFRAMLFRNRNYTVYVAQLFGRAGRALAQLHRLMEQPEARELTVDLSGSEGLTSEMKKRVKQILDNSVSVPFHGDFGTGNIWVSRSNKLIIFDPIPSKFCPAPNAHLAPVYYDIGHLISSLWCVCPLWLQPFFSGEIASEFVEEFLGGYDAESGSRTERAAAFAVALHLLDRYVTQFAGRAERNGLLFSLRMRFFSRSRGALLSACRRVRSQSQHSTSES